MRRGALRERSVRRAKYYLLPSDRGRHLTISQKMWLLMRRLARIKALSGSESDAEGVTLQLIAAPLHLTTVTASLSPRRRSRRSSAGCAAASRRASATLCCALAPHPFPLSYLFQCNSFADL